jgi:hypothetical protein
VVYGYYLLLWIYRYEHIVTVAVGDLDGAPCRSTLTQHLLRIRV